MTSRSEKPLTKSILIFIALFYLALFLFLPLIVVFYSALSKGFVVYLKSFNDPYALAASVIIGEASVTFQFFPIYLQTQGYMDIIPTSLKCLKAKTCFNFKKGEQVNTKEISALLKKGIQTWKKLGYMK